MIAPGLGPEWLDRLHDGDWSGYRSPDHAAAGLALACVSARWCLQDLQAALGDPNNRAALWFWQDANGKPRTDGMRRIGRAWSTATRRAQEHPPLSGASEARHQIGALLADANSTPWPGRTGATDQRVLNALCAIATRAGRVVLRASVRQVALEAGVGKDAAAAALNRLSAGGWLRVQDKAKGPGIGTTYRLQQATVHNPDSREPTLPGGTAVGVVNASPAHDLWRFLGPVAHQVYDALGDEPMTQAQVRAATGRSGGAVSKHLRGLAGDGLAVRHADETWTRGAADLDALARDLGAAGLGEDQRKRYDRERAAYALRALKVAQDRANDSQDRAAEAAEDERQAWERGPKGPWARNASLRAARRAREAQRDAEAAERARQAATDAVRRVEEQMTRERPGCEQAADDDQDQQDQHAQHAQHRLPERTAA